jgi:hypothetical protein
MRNAPNQVKASPVPVRLVPLLMLGPSKCKWPVKYDARGARPWRKGSPAHVFEREHLVFGDLH